MGRDACILGVNDAVTLEKRDISSADDEPFVRSLVSTYSPAENMIRDSADLAGHRVLTFAPILKYKTFPLPQIVAHMLALGSQGMGCPVEIEFCVDLSLESGEKAEFAILQIRPMSAREEMVRVLVDKADISRAFVATDQALGNTINSSFCDIVYVKPDTFEPAGTPEIARQVAKINTRLFAQDRKYLLMGPGRWGSADRWLGIPTTWADICGVGAIVETAHDRLKAEPSQGSHFFHNLTTLGINYLTVGDTKDSFVNWRQVSGLKPEYETEFVAHVSLEKPMTLKIDGRTGMGVVLLV